MRLKKAISVLFFVILACQMAHASAEVDSIWFGAELDVLFMDFEERYPAEYALIHLSTEDRGTEAIFVDNAIQLVQTYDDAIVFAKKKKGLYSSLYSVDGGQIEPIPHWSDVPCHPDKIIAIVNDRLYYTTESSVVSVSADDDVRVYRAPQAPGYFHAAISPDGGIVSCNESGAYYKDGTGDAWTALPFDGLRLDTALELSGCVTWLNHEELLLFLNEQPEGQAHNWTLYKYDVRKMACSRFVAENGKSVSLYDTTISGAPCVADGSFLIYCSAPYDPWYSPGGDDHIVSVSLADAALTDYGEVSALIGMEERYEYTTYTGFYNARLIAR